MAGNLVWCDIPVDDVERAIAFYSAVLGVEVAKEEFPGGVMGVIPHEGGAVGACLVISKDAEPSMHGPLIYLSCEGRLREAAEAVEPFGGRIVEPQHEIGPYGYRVLIYDCEGNRVALHSMKS